MRSSVFSEEQQAFIKDNRRGITNRALLDRLNSSFGTDFRIGQLTSYCYSRGLLNGVDARLDGSQGTATRFRKGEAPMNKGKSWDELGIPEETQARMRSTCFRKGGRAHNRQPVGTVARKTDGYLWKKTAEPDAWKQLHRLVWEERNGPVPDGMAVIFIDGDRDNTDISNLMLMSREENAMRRKYGKPGGAERGLAAAYLTKIEAAAARLACGDDKKKGAEDAEQDKEHA